MSIDKMLKYLFYAHVWLCWICLVLLAKAFMFTSEQFIRKVASPKHVVHDSHSGQNGATLTADLYIYALGPVWELNTFLAGISHFLLLINKWFSLNVLQFCFKWNWGHLACVAGNGLNFMQISLIYSVYSRTLTLLRGRLSFTAKFHCQLLVIVFNFCGHPS